MFKKFGSVRRQLMLIYSVLIIFFVVSMSAFSYMGFVRIITRQSLSYSTGIMEQVRNNIDTSLRNIEQASYIIFSNPEILGYMNTAKTIKNLDSWQKYNIVKLMTDIMWSVGGSNGDIFCITYYDNEGNYISANPGFILGPLGNMKISADIADGRFVWLPRDESLGIVTLVRKIRDMEMNPVGYLRFDIRLKTISGYFSEEISHLGGTQFILENSQIVIDDGEPGTENLDPSFLEDYSKVDGSGYSILDINKEKQVVVYSSSRFNSWKYGLFVTFNG